MHDSRTSNTDLSSVTELISGAAYLPPELKDQLSALTPARFNEGVFAVNR